MTDWRAPGILLATRRHGESAAILEVLTRERGRHAGLVHGGAGRRLGPVLQPGAQLDLAWRARLDAHLGTFTVEPIRARAGLIGDRLALAGLSSITALAVTTLPERQGYPALYDATEALLDRMETAGDWPPHYVGWELTLLAALGHGLELSACAVTGATGGLAYVSPRTGRAVSRAGAGYWADRLLALPPFLTADAGERQITAADVIDGLTLTGHFLATALYPALGRDGPPAARERLVRAVARA